MVQRSRTAALLLAIAAATLAVERGGALGWAENALVEARMTASPRNASGEIVLVGIDHRSLKAMGAWPWSREVYAEMTRELLELGANEVFLDIDFSAPSSSIGADDALAAALESAQGAVILPAFRQSEGIGSDGRGAGSNLPLERFREHAWMVSVNVATDPDGRVRQYPWGQVIDGDDVPSAAALLAGAFGSADANFPINFSVTPNSIPAHAAIDLIEGRLGADAIEGRSVIVGAHALELRDQFVVPVHGIVGGATLHILAAETLLQGIMPVTVNGLLPFLLVVPLAIALALSSLGNRPGLLLLSYAAMSAAAEAAAFALHASAAVMLPTHLLHTMLLGFGLAIAARELDLRGWLLRFARIESRNHRNVLTQVIADASDAIVIVNERGEVIEINERARDFFGTPDRSPGPLLAQMILPPDLARAVTDAMAAARFGARLPEAPREAQFRGSGHMLQVEYDVTVSRMEAPTRDTRTTFIGCLTVRDVTAAREQQARLDRLARFDTLTGAMHRHELTTRLAADLEAGGGGAVLALKLNRFKTVNATLGRAVGDEVLRTVVRRLREADRRIAHVARLGGDTFAVACPDIDEGEARALGGRLLELLSERFDIDGVSVSVGARIGLAVAAKPRDAGFLLSQAEAALDSARETAGEDIRLYDSATSARQARARLLERSLASALEDDELYLVYQPQIDLETQHLLGAEALLRWNHRALGAISPVEFITIAESSGMIERLGRWVLERACHDAVAWPESTLVAVNVSPLQLQRGDLVADVRRALALSGLAPSRLQLEITESLFMEASESLSGQLQTIRRMGVTIALDDFGSGFSSMGYLATLPIDKLKLDRMFARNVEQDGANVAIVKAVVGLARDLGLTLLCEGIETGGQEARLRALGCRQGQGFLFGKPQPQEYARHLLGASDSVPTMLSA